MDTTNSDAPWKATKLVIDAFEAMRLVPRTASEASWARLASYALARQAEAAAKVSPHVIRDELPPTEGK